MEKKLVLVKFNYLPLSFQNIAGKIEQLITD